MIEVDNKALKDYKFIDLFCGIGGFHLALSSFGAKCVFASDIDENAREVYKNNFGMEPYGDITQIKVDDIPQHDIICAGFPCQPFSISGNRKGFNDEQGRGKLFFNIVSIAKHHKPKVLLLENVKNFEKHDNGNTLKRVYEELEGIGYNVFHSVLCASDYGVPQQRKRIYIVAFRKDLGVEKFEFPVKLNEYKVLKDILVNQIDNEIKGQYKITREYVIHGHERKRLKQLYRIGEIGLGRQGERIYSIYGQATTLSSQGGGLGGKTGMYLIDGTVRKLYPRECARLMGFPDTFQLANSQEKSYKQFGNSVVVDVLQEIIRGISIKLEEAKDDKH